MISIKIKAPKVLGVKTKNLEKSLSDAVEYVRKKWMGYVSGYSIPGAGFRVRSATYLKSIMVKRNSKFNYSISAGGKIPFIIERGFESFDMKPGLLNGSHARMSSKGDRFNVIPIKGTKFFGLFKTTNFRRVSSKSRPGSWIHPGVEARPVFSFLVANTSKTVEDILAKGFSKDLKEAISND